MPVAELGVQATGVAEAVRDLGKVKTAQDAIGQSAERSNRAATAATRAAAAATSSAAQAASNAGRSYGAMASALGNVGSVVGRLSPQLGAVGQVLGQIGGATSALTGAMGPLGVIMAGVTTLAGAAAIAFARQTDALNTQRAAAQRLTRSYDDLVSAAQSAITASERLARIQRGGGSLAEQRAFTAQAQQQRDLFARAEAGDEGALIELRSRGLSPETRTEATPLERIRALAVGGSAIRATDQERAFFAERQRQLAGQIVERSGLEGAASAIYSVTGRDDGLDAENERMRREAERRARGRHRERAPTLTDLMEEASGGGDLDLDTLARGDLAPVGITSDPSALREAAEAQRAAAESAKDHATAQAELSDKAKEAQTAFGEGYVNSLDEVIEKWRDANDASRRAGMGMLSTTRLLERGIVAVGNNIAETIGGTMKGAFEDALGAWLDGSKSFVQAAEDMAKGVIKALTIESIVQAVTEVARAVASFASQDYASGVAHLAAAAAWGAVGVVAGGVGAAVGAFGGGGADKTASQGADNRDLSRGAVAERDASQPITVIVYPEVFANRNAQRFVYNTIDAGARNGRTIDSRALRGMGR